MPRYTRHELKQDQLRTTFEEFEEFVKKRYKEIATVAAIIIVVVGLAAGLRFYIDRQETQANLQLGAALQTFSAYVGPASAGGLVPGMQTFPTAREKYKKALDQFSEIVQKYSRYPQPKAAAIARYHVGLCQAQLGNEEGAIKTLRDVAGDSDREIASLAQFALANELTKAGKIDDAVKLYQELASRPTVSVPEATARLAMADAYRATQPAKAREIYQQLEKQFAANATLAQAVKEQMASLPK